MPTPRSQRATSALRQLERLRSIRLEPVVATEYDVYANTMMGELLGVLKKFKQGWGFQQNLCQRVAFTLAQTDDIDQAIAWLNTP